MGTIISNHNRKIMSKQDQTKTERLCNCRKNRTCPLSGKCLSKNIVYKATEQSSKVNYVGMTSTDFKARLGNHTYNFKTYSKRKATALALYVWDNNLNPTPNIKWKILRQCRPYSPGQKSCDTCISEKLEILAHSKDPKNINKKTDLGTRCIHKKDFQLGKVTWDSSAGWGWYTGTPNSPAKCLDFRCLGTTGTVSLGQGRYRYHKQLSPTAPPCWQHQASLTTEWILIKCLIGWDWMTCILHTGRNAGTQQIVTSTDETPSVWKPVY